MALGGIFSFLSVKKRRKTSPLFKQICSASNVDDLSRFLKSGASSPVLDEKELLLLLEEMSRGESCIGLTRDGNLLRVVSVAKPIVLDPNSGELLVELFHTSIGTKDNIKIKATGISEKFNPLREDSTGACARALREELLIQEVPRDAFSNKCLKIIETVNSDKYGGIRTEYHLYVHMVKPFFVSEIQRSSVPRSVLTPTNEECKIDPRTLWWIWLSPTSPKVINAHCESALKQAGFALEKVPLEAMDKFGRTPAETVVAQMELAKKYLDFIMSS